MGAISHNRIRLPFHTERILANSLNYTNRSVGPREASVDFEITRDGVFVAIREIVNRLAGWACQCSGFSALEIKRVCRLDSASAFLFRLVAGWRLLSSNRQTLRSVMEVIVRWLPKKGPR
jgi:hypothetical protein